MKKCSLSIFTLVVVLGLLRGIEGHGRLMDPPARNCMWRFGYPNAVNWNDNQNWCGGAQVMQVQNGGLCGVCGDNYADSVPRAHEIGGEFGKGIITRRFATGQTLDSEVELTANHQGWFQFRLCPVTDPDKEVTQECLDKHLLKVVDAHGKLHDTYSIRDKDRKLFNLKLRLPPFITCSRCVLQWTYVAANTWGTCTNGTEAVGCGAQETFKNCADIAIIPNSGGVPPKAPHPNLIFIRDNRTKVGEPPVPLIIRSQVCVGVGTYSTIPNMNEWCQTNCLAYRYPSHCPADKCLCPLKCEAVGDFKQRDGSDAYCLDQCLVYPQGKNCTQDKCNCY